MITRSKVPALAIAVMLAAAGISLGGAAHADVRKPGGPPAKHHHPVLHGPGSSHNPIVQHPPLHGPGSSHNPIVVNKDCNDPNTLCRRP